MISENPWLVATVTGVAVILALAFVSASRRRRSADIVRREPVLHSRTRGHRDMGQRHSEAADPILTDRPGARFGFAALTLSFLIGAIAGAGGLAATSSGGLAAAVKTVAAFLDDGPSQSREGPGLQDLVTAGAKADGPPLQPAASALQPSLAAPGDRPEDVKVRLAAFADNLQKELPKDAGPEIALSSVAVAGDTLNLGYTVGRSMTEDEIAAFDAYVMRTIKSLFCGKEAREIRYLNESGIAFHMVYADPRGATVAKLTVPPNFCA